MKTKLANAAMSLGLVLMTGLALTAQSQKQGRLNVVRGGAVTVVNSAGSVRIHSGSGEQVVYSATTYSPKVEVDAGGTPDRRRADLRTHALSQQRPTSEEARTDYDIAVPPGISVNVTTGTAPVTVEGISGDVTVASDTGQITIRDVNQSYITVRSVAAGVALSNMTGAHIEVTSTTGTVQLANVTGPKVAVNTASGNVAYQGDCSVGSYTMTTHSGAIDMTLPQNASIDVTARSVTGSVENDFPLQPKQHLSFIPSDGRSFAGTSNSGSSSVELQSFSGKIRVKKQ